jgi:hypothetical protein
MNAAQILDKVFDVYKISFWKQLAFAAIVGVVAFLIMGVVMVAAATMLQMMLLIILFTRLDGAVYTFVTLMVAVLLPIFIVWLGVVATGVILISREAFLGRVVRLPRYRLASTIVRAVTAILAQLIAALPYLVMAGLIIYAYVSLVPYVDMVGRFGYYTMLFILTFAALFGFFLYMNIYSLAVAVAVNERVWFFRALIRSASLIKGNFWRLFGVRVIWMLAIGVLMGSAQGLLTILPFVSGALAAGTPFEVYVMLFVTLLVGAGGIILFFAVQPLDGIITAVIYFNKRMKKEGFDIEMRIEELHRAL